jgi:hypothetical protein
MKTLTHQQIDEMPAGREMDELIAEEVMGLDGSSVMWTAGIPPHPCYSHYSTDIAAAWEVAKKFNLTMLQKVSWNNPQGWTWNAYCGDASGSDLKDAYADTAPLAICRAALKAVKIYKQDQYQIDELELFLLLKPIPVTVTGGDKNYIASFSEANISMSGDSAQEALINLKSMISDSFIDLDCMSRDDLGPAMVKRIDVLREYISYPKSWNSLKKSS